MRNQEQLDQAVGEAIARSRAQALTRATFLRRSAVGALGVTSMSALLAACGDGGSGGGATTAVARSALRPDIAVRYDPSVPAGEKPSGLPRSFNYVAFSTDPFWVTFSNAMKQGCDDAGIDFGDANAQADAAKYLTLIQQQLTRTTGGTFLVPIDPKAEVSLAKQAIDAGVYTVANAMAPGSTQIGENYYTYGEAIGEEAAEYINRTFDGEAEILLFNEGESIGILRERYDGVRAALKRHAPGSSIVKDLTTRNTADDGFKQTSSAFAANPDIKVIIAPGIAAVGAFAALEASGKASPDKYIASIGGTNDELKAIKKPNSAYKATWAEPWLLIGYLSARWTGDWLDGKAVPMGVELPAAVVTIENIEKYEADMADPSRVLSEGRVEEYVGLWGTINYATRDSYYTKTWFGPKA